MPLDHIASSAERTSFRDKFNVRLVTDKESGASLVRLPGGVYGFTGAPSSEELPAFTTPYFQSFELLKTAAGDIHYIGYLTASEAASLNAATQALTIHLFPEPHAEATHLVAVPESRVDRKKNPTRENGNAMAIDIVPAG